MIKIGPAPHIAVDVEGSGPLVVFIHGIGGNRTNWVDQLPVFAEHFTAVAMDLRGYGDSDDYQGSLHFPDFSEDVLKVIDHFGVAQAHLVGLSMGGRVALDFFGHYPERLASMVLADTTGGLRGPTSPAQVREFLQTRQRPLLEGKTPEDIAPDVTNVLVGPSTTPETRARIERSIAALHTQSYLKTLEAAVWYEGYPDYTTITIPTLLIVGEEDTVAKPDVMERIASYIPGARLERIAKASHMSNLDQPEAFNRLVLDFLKEQVSV
ncbi:MAG: alpha/beta hydrolase [Chloroflexi bacterium]|nr:alpha/beta hydrolase [Chloroflexota bacterium]